MTFTKERIIEELKASTQNASGMFEINEDTICALMELLESRADAEPVAGTQFRAVADLYSIAVPGGRSVTYSTDAAEASDFRAMGWAVQEYVKLERLQDAYTRPQPAPVVQDEVLCDFYDVSNWPDLVRELVKHVEQLQDAAKRNVKPWEDTFPETLLPAYIDKVKQADESCRAAMLQGKAEPVSQGDELPVVGWVRSDCQNEDRKGNAPLFIFGKNDPSSAWGVAYMPLGNSPVIPDGYALVPVEPTMAMLDEFDSIIDYGADDSNDAWSRLLAAAWIKSLPAAPQQEAESE